MRYQIELLKRELVKKKRRYFALKNGTNVIVDFIHVPPCNFGWDYL